MPRTSRYVIVVDNLSSVTTSKDIRKVLEEAGPVRDVVRSSKYRCALVEYNRSSDADYALRKFDYYRMDGRTWRVEPATRQDFKFFGWKWYEDTPSPPPRGRSPSRSPSRSRSRSRSSERSKSPPATPYNDDGRRERSS